MYFNLERSDTTILSQRGSLTFIPIGRVTANVTVKNSHRQGCDVS